MRVYYTRLFKGKRFVKKKHFIEVHIPKGIPDKYEIVYENQASEGWFTSPGDVSFVISVQKHPNFTRNGADLIHHATISIKEVFIPIGLNVAFASVFVDMNFHNGILGN